MNRFLTSNNEKIKDDRNIASTRKERGEGSERRIVIKMLWYCKRQKTTKE